VFAGPSVSDVLQACHTSSQSPNACPNPVHAVVLDAVLQVSGRTYYLDKANFHDEQLMHRLFVADGSSSTSTEDQAASSMPQDGTQ
jgi:hypothetical protein